MLYGFCTGFATKPLFALDYDLYSAIMASGFDYVESPLMTLMELDRKEFDAHLDIFKSPVACNLFPGSLPLYTSDEKQIAEYVDEAFDRLKATSTNKVIFGSGKARSFSSMEKSDAYNILIDITRDIIGPASSKNGVLTLIEPLKRGECNIINTLKEGRAFVEDVDSESVKLMADLYHMESNGENIEDLRDCLQYIHHIHIAGPERNLEATLSDSYIAQGLRILKEEGYDKAISFETDLNGDMGKELIYLKTLMQ